MKRLLFIALFLCSPFTVTASERVWKGAEKVQLDNGLTVITKENHSHPIVSVQVWVKVGSVNETAKTSGLSHFLEHLLFKGTEKYPADEISRKVETQGGVINAATSKEFTHYYIDIQSSAYRDAVRILADVAANSVFPPEEIEKERPVVVEEIRRHSDNPGAVLYDHFSEALFLETPYRRSIIGSADIIKNVTRDEIMDYYHTYYVPDNMVVCIVGDVNAGEALALVKDTFGKQKKGPVPAQPGLVEKEHAPRSVSRDKDVEQAYWLGGFIGPVIKSDDQFAADIAMTVLGGGRSSRLYRKLREEKQLVYSIGSSFWSQRGSGAGVISAIFAPEKREETMAGIREIMDQLASDGPTALELQRAKEMTRSQWYFGNETYHELASLLGYWQLQGRPDMADRYIEGIEKVTQEDVIIFFKNYFVPQGLSEALLMPKS